MEKIRKYTVVFPEDGIELIERLLMTPLGRNLYRVEETALSEAPVSYHDIIEANWRLGRGLRFRRLVEKSGLRVFRFVLSQKITSSEPYQAFLRRATAHGGHWEAIFGGILIVHLPRGSACRPKSELRAIIQRLSQDAA